MSSTNNDADPDGHVVNVTVEEPAEREYWYDSRDGILKETVNRGAGQIQQAVCSCGEQFSSVAAITDHLEDVHEGSGENHGAERVGRDWRFGRDRRFRRASEDPRFNR